MTTQITACMFDLYHGDYLDSPTYEGDIALFLQAKAAGQIALIHKLSDGVKFKDPMALGRLGAAVKAGLLIGGYHYIQHDEPLMPQIANFMAMAGAARTLSSQLVLVLDNEPGGPDNIKGTPATDKLCNDFSAAIAAAMGVAPTIYGPKSAFYAPSNLGASPLWLAKYGPTPTATNLPPGWRNWAWWQRTDGTIGPWAGAVPGIGRCDQSAFAGSADEARAWWAAQAVR